MPREKDIIDAKATTSKDTENGISIIKPCFEVLL